MRSRLYDHAHASTPDMYGVGILLGIVVMVAAIVVVMVTVMVVVVVTIVVVEIATVVMAAASGR